MPKTIYTYICIINTLWIPLFKIFNASINAFVFGSVQLLQTWNNFIKNFLLKI